MYWFSVVFLKLLVSVEKHFFILRPSRHTIIPWVKIMYHTSIVDLLIT